MFLAHGDHEKHYGPWHPAGTAEAIGKGAGKRH
nr:MAG TPA: hypothetical protein [Caudoviricetes sp.]